MASLASPPFETLEGIVNFRDIGGYPVPDSPSKSVRRGLVYRSALPREVSQESIQWLRARGVVCSYDLRSAPEIAGSSRVVEAGRTSGEIGGINRIHVPVFPQQDYSPESLAIRYQDYAEGTATGFTRAYKDILKHAGPAYRKILLHIRDHPEQAIIVHCTAGKDRTGVLVALILKLAGVNDKTVAREYSLTEQGLGPMRDIMINHLIQHPSLQGDRSRAQNMVGAKEENMLTTLEMLERDFGGVREYLKSYCGFEDGDLDVIRSNLRCDVNPIL